ncbi:TPA: hypothetical protein QCR24_004284 [Bacillus cereus]|nr:hypothetical protein [Bacillus cereus]
MKKWNELFHGFHERMENLSVFHPILQLNSKNRLQNYPLMSLGMAVLLYILENMLSENKATTNEELTHFLQELLEEVYRERITFEKADEIRSVLVDEFLRNKPGVTTLGTITRPFMPMNIIHFFHPARMFDKQKLKKNQKEQEEFIPVLDEQTIIEKEQQEKLEKERLNKEKKLILKLLLHPLLTKENYTVREVLDTLREEDFDTYEMITKDLLLYSYLITLHTSETKFEVIPTELLPFVELLARHLHELTLEYPEYEEIGYVSINPNGEPITLESGYILVNFTIQRGNLYVLGQK